MRSTINGICLFLILISLSPDVFAQKAIITTAAGNGSAGFAGDGGAATAARINGPTDVAVDAAGNLYIADRENNRVRKVNASTGVITTVAGNGAAGSGGDKGPAVAAALNRPSGVALDRWSNLYIADFGNNRIRRVDVGTGIITTFDVIQFYPKEQLPGANDPFWNNLENLLGIRYYKDGYGLPVAVSGPVSLAFNAAGDLFVAEKTGNRIRKIERENNFVSTVAGTGTAGFSGDGGPAASARINAPTHVAVDSAGNVYFTDSGNNRVRRVAASSEIITTVVAQLNRPGGLTIDGAGNLLIADTGSERIRRIAAGSSAMTTLAGDGSTGDGCAAATSSLDAPQSVAINAAGNLIYVAETSGQRVRVITLDAAASPPTLDALWPRDSVAGSTTAMTFAGSGFFGAAGTAATSACRVTSISVSGTGVTVSGVKADTDTDLAATFTVASDAAPGPREVTVTTENGTSAAVQFTVQGTAVPPPTLTSISPARLVKGSTATVTLTGTNFDTRPGATNVSVEELAISDVRVESPTSITATFTASTDTTIGEHGVTVATGEGTTGAVPVTVLPQGPTFVFEMPQTLNPTEHTPIRVALAAPGAEPVTGELTLTFAPNANASTDDPNVVFVNSQAHTRLASVTFPVNTATGEVSLPNAVLQAGTVAGTIELSMNDVKVAGMEVEPGGRTFTIDIPRLPPVITNVRILNRTESGFDVEITGYSTSREISGAQFNFSAAKGAHLVTLDLQPDVVSSFTTYYGSDASTGVGGAFLYVQPFIIQQGDVDAVASVSVSLSNAQGTSQPKSANTR